MTPRLAALVTALAIALAAAACTEVVELHRRDDTSTTDASLPDAPTVDGTATDAGPAPDATTLDSVTAD